jgi:hypothetical protein
VLTFAEHDARVSTDASLVTYRLNWGPSMTSTSKSPDAGTPYVRVIDDAEDLEQMSNAIEPDSSKSEGNMNASSTIRSTTKRRPRTKLATSFNIFPKKPGRILLIPRKPRLLSKEDSERVLRNGVGKVPLVPIHHRTPTRMEPPPPPSGSSALKHVDQANGYVVRTKTKRRQPLFRDVPSTQEESRDSAADATTEPSTPEPTNQDLEQNYTPLQQPGTAETLLKHMRFGSPDDTEDSTSGSSHVDSDDEELALHCMEGISLSFLEPHEVLEPPPTVELPECFKIPFNPEIAEIALEETLHAFGISANPLQFPLHQDVNDMPPLDVRFGSDQEVALEFSFMPFDKVAWSREFYSQPPVNNEPLLSDSPTFVEQYMESLPILTEETQFLSHADFDAMQAAISATLQEKGLELPNETDVHDFSFLSDNLLQVEPTVPYPAYFIPVLPEPVPVEHTPPVDDYGDGSQFLVTFPDEEPSEDPFIPIFTEKDFFPDSEPYSSSQSLLDTYLTIPEPEYRVFVSDEPTRTLQPSELINSSYPSSIQSAPHLPPISLDSDGIGATAESSSFSAQKLIDFLVSLPGSLVSSVTSLVGSGSTIESSQPRSSPGPSQLSPIDFSDTDDFKEEITAYANLRVYGTTSSPYDDPNYYPVLW